MTKTITKIPLIIILTLIALLLWPLHVSAVTSVSAETESELEQTLEQTDDNGEQTENDTEATDSALDDRSQKMLENLERLTREKDQTETLKNIYDDVSAKKRGFIAQVVSLKDKTVKVQTIDQTELFLTFDKSTSLIRTGREATADTIEIPEWIDIDDWLVVIGVTEDEIFSPRRVLISTVNLAPKKKIVQIGNLASITRTKLSYKLTRDPETALEITINTNTVLEDNAGNPLKITDFDENDQILVIGLEGTNSTTAKTIRLISPAQPTEEKAD